MKYYDWEFRRNMTLLFLGVDLFVLFLSVLILWSGLK
jgi:Na+-transporting methylmalonyl-CoA/oxaloacetate decarboxylase gamma subunit